MAREPSLWKSAHRWCNQVGESGAGAAPAAGESLLLEGGVFVDVDGNQVGEAVATAYYVPGRGYLSVRPQDAEINRELSYRTEAWMVSS